MKKSIYFTFLLLLNSQLFLSAQVNTDSLKKVWKNQSLKDSQRMNALYDLAWDGFLFTYPDSSFYYAEILYDFASQKKDYKSMSNALNTQGASFYIRGKYDKAIFYYEKNIELLKKHKNDSDLADAYNNIGILYDERGDYVKAIEYFSKSLKINEKKNKPKGIAISLNNIGNIYFSQSEHALALQNYKKSIEYYISLNDRKGLAGTYNNMANVYKAKGQLDSALFYQENCLKEYEKINYSIGIAGSYNNLGMIFHLKKDFKLAIEYFQKSISISEPINDQLGLANSYSNLSSIYLHFTEEAIKMKHPSEVNGNKLKAFEYATLAFRYANETGSVLERRNAAFALYKLNKLNGNYKIAFEMQELYYLLRDSMTNEENQKAVLRQKIQSDYEIKTIQDSVQNAESKKLLKAEHDLEVRNQKQRNYFLFAGLALTFIFLIFIFNRFRITNKQKKIIEKQKHQVDETLEELEEKQKEITDSINYAKRLQQAILAPVSAIQQVFPDSFLLYQPKDIVAGDFYFFEKTETHIFYAAADCTGHGVPGAMVSVVCSNALTRCVKEFKLFDPSDILNKARELVVETFEKSGMDVKDGMDISLVALAYREKKESNKEIEFTTIFWAGANNPLWYSNNGEIIELKADKQPIGKTENPKSFTSHTINIVKGEMIFLLTDGYADQFGGPKGKKFKYAPLQQLLKENLNNESEKIKMELINAFDKWKAEHEQVDDVTIIGFRVD